MIFPMFGDFMMKMRMTMTTGLLFALTVTIYMCCLTFNGYLEAVYLKSTWLSTDITNGAQTAKSMDVKGLQWYNTGALTSIVAQHDSAVCTNPRLRKEWRTLTDREKEAWTSAVKCLVKYPSPANRNFETKENIDLPYNRSGSLYDDFTFVHMKLNNDIHQTGLFLPFHRYFLWSFEQALRLHCNYIGVMPYWNWTQDAMNFEHASIFADPDPKTGLGGFGDPAHDAIVLDGAFSRLPLSYPVPHTLRREYTPYPFRNLTPQLYPTPSFAASSAFTPKEIHKMVNGFQGDFKGFQSYLEGMQGAHMSVHLIMGGDLGGTCLKSASYVCGPDATWSPNEPMFWLHHGMVDKVWHNWQRAHVDNFWAYEGGTVRDLDTWPQYTNGAPPAMTLDFNLPTAGILVGNYTLKRIFNITSNDPLCYIYD